MNENSDERNALVLGALLHDIGKFEFRARRDYTPHEEYSEYFVNQHLQRFRCLNSIRERIRRLVSYHHYAELASASLQDADHTAASERESDSSRETRRPLISILSHVDIGKGSKPDRVFYYLPGKVTADDLFPRSITGVTAQNWQPDDAEMIRFHQEAWEAFLKDIQEMPDGNVDALINTLLAVMEKHLSRIVSAAYRSTPDISLFDHSRMVAALAVCGEEAKGVDKPFLAIQGDVSGIQKFIYRMASPDETTKRTAKRLRGRSFFISLFSDAVATLYLRRLSLHRTNLVFSGGGHFLILAPNTEVSRQVCESFEQEVNRWLHEEMRGDLGLVTAIVEVSGEEVRDFAGVLQRVGYEMTQAKRRKCRSVLDEKFFEPFRYDRTMDACAVCQRDFIKGSGDRNICDRCQGHEEMGQHLVHAKYLVQVVGKDIRYEKEWFYKGFQFGDVSVRYGLPTDRDEVRNLLTALRGQAVESVVIHKLNDTDFLDRSLVQQTEDFGLPATFGFQFVGNHAPTDGKNLLEFGELAEIESENYPMLGIVRMDVDSLGTIFNRGLGENKTPSRLASLSREMSLFFLGYVNLLAKKHRIYITYSGGDDLFVVGSWKKAIDFAQDVRKDFGRFACNNSNVTLSGGLLFCKPDFPIGRAAEACDEEEKRAKGRFKQEKDAVAAFGEVVQWKKLDHLMEFAGELLAGVERGGPDETRLPRSFVHRLLQMRPEPLKEALSPEAATRRMKQNMARLHYLVARHGATQPALQKNKEAEEPNPKLNLLARLVEESDLMENIVIPASYVLYRTREKEGKNGEN